ARRGLAQPPRAFAKFPARALYTAGWQGGKSRLSSLPPARLCARLAFRPLPPGSGQFPAGLTYLYPYVPSYLYKQAARPIAGRFAVCVSAACPASHWAAMAWGVSVRLIHLGQPRLAFAGGFAICFWLHPPAF